jgi:hypothetical protein
MIRPPHVRLECAPNGGHLAGLELTGTAGLSEDESHGQIASLCLTGTPSRTLGNVGTECLDHSGLMFANLTTFAHFAVSAAINALNSGALNGMGSLPNSARCAMALSPEGLRGHHCDSMKFLLPADGTRLPVEPNENFGTFPFEQRSDRQNGLSAS